MLVVVLLIKGSFDFFLDSYFFFPIDVRREKKTRREVTFKEMPWCRGITALE